MNEPTVDNDEDGMKFSPPDYIQRVRFVEIVASDHLYGLTRDGFVYQYSHPAGWRPLTDQVASP